MKNYWPLLKSLKIGGPTKCKYQGLVFNDYTYDNLDIQRTRAPVRFVGLKNSFDIAFVLIMGKAKLMELLMFCCVFLYKHQSEKKDPQAKNI